jgi:hypothetical protein
MATSQIDKKKRKKEKEKMYWDSALDDDDDDDALDCLMSEQKRERERERERECVCVWGNQQTESRKRCNQSMGSDCSIRRKRVGKGKARKVIKFIIINQPAGFCTCLLLLLQKTLNFCLTTHDAFFCFVLHVFFAKLLVWINHYSSTPFSL